MAAAPDQSALAQALKRSALFGPLPDQALSELASRLVPVTFAAGATVLREGESSEDAYFILRGKAGIGSTNLIGQQVVLAVLGPGEIFGEGGLVNGTARSATVCALTPLETYRISRPTFDWLGSHHPQIADRVRTTFDLLQIDGFLKRASPFAHLPAATIKRLVPQMEKRRFSAGETIIRENEPGDTFFLIESGAANVLKRGRRQATLKAGDFFGEVALVTAEPRSATVGAVADTTVLTLSREAFEAILTEQRSVGEQIREVVRIRFGGASSQSVPLPDPVSTFIPFAADVSRKRLWGVLVGGAVMLGLLTMLAVVTGQTLFVYATLVCGALVAPALFLTYLSRTQLLTGRPKALVLTCVLSAGIGVPLALAVERQLGAGPGQLGAAFAIAVIEELAKILGVLWLLHRRPLRFRMDGILYGAAAGMGFAALENALYGLARLHALDDMLAVLFARALLAPFGHGAWTALVCAAIWREKGAQGPRLGWQVVAAFSTAVLLHAFWNWRPLPHVLNLVWVLGVAVVGIVLLRGVLRDALREERGSVSMLNPGATGSLGPTQRVRCAGCGQVAPSGVRYCPRCGAALHAPVESRAAVG